MAETVTPSTQRRFMPSFAVLRSFECAARHESFTAAAEELHLTQSAISRQIKELEAAVGVELFARVGRRVRLTEAGDRFATELTVDLERIRQTVFRAVSAGERNKALRIATLPTFATRWLVPRLADFERRHPGTEINLTARLDRFDFAAEHFDAAIHFGAPNWPGAEAERLCDEVVVPVATSSFAAEHGLNTPDDLLAAPLIHLETRPTAWNQWFALVGIDGIGAVHGKQFSQFSMVIAGALASLGACLGAALSD